MAKSATQITNELRAKWQNLVMDFLKEHGEEVLPIGNGKFVCPTLDELGGERFVRILVEIPKGSRDGEAYDGYFEAEVWKDKETEKEKTEQAKIDKKNKEIAEKERKKAEKEQIKANKKEKLDKEDE